MYENVKNETVVFQLLPIAIKTGLSNVAPGPVPEG
jgi:hypothetical protein